MMNFKLAIFFACLTTILYGNGATKYICQLCLFIIVLIIVRTKLSLVDEMCFWKGEEGGLRGYRQWSKTSLCFSQDLLN